MANLELAYFYPKALITFTHAEVALMIFMSQHHYDNRCKLMSERPEDPMNRAYPEHGKLYYMKQTMDNPLSEDDPTEGEGYQHQFDFSDLDLLAKVCEGSQFLPEDKKVEGFEIYNKIRSFLKQLSDLRPPDFKPSSKEDPYLLTRTYQDKRAYNPEYGDDRVCKCGHTYDRHFDWMEDNDPVGCKYCGCYDFEEAVIKEEDEGERCVEAGSD